MRSGDAERKKEGVEETAFMHRVSRGMKGNEPKDPRGMCVCAYEEQVRDKGVKEKQV